VFFIEPPGDDGRRRAYFGPLTYGPEAPAELRLVAGPGGNVQSASFTLDAERPIRVEGHHFNKKDPQALPEEDPEPPQELAREPVEPRRVQLLSGPFSHDSTLAQTMARSVALLARPAVTAEILIDTELYGAVLLPRQLVRVQGAGPSYDGSYYVRSAAHSLFVGSGSHTQKVVLAREGLGDKGSAKGGF
jgi:hypothetical protein